MYTSSKCWHRGRNYYVTTQSTVTSTSVAEIGRQDIPTVRHYYPTVMTSLATRRCRCPLMSPSLSTFSWLSVSNMYCWGIFPKNIKFLWPFSSGLAGTTHHRGKADNTSTKRKTRTLTSVINVVASCSCFQNAWNPTQQTVSVKQQQNITNGTINNIPDLKCWQLGNCSILYAKPIKLG